MKLFYCSQLVRRFSILALTVLLATFFTVSFAPEQANAAGAPVNAPAVVLFVHCPDLIYNTTSVDFYYVRLDGTNGMRTATTSNRGLTYNSSTPSVQFYQVSIDYANYNALYEFSLSNGNYYDIWVGSWNRDRRNGNLSVSFYC